MAGEQLIEQNAERIDVGSGGDVFTADLFRAGIFGSKQPLLCACHRGWLISWRCREQLGDAEIQQLRYPLGRDQYVAGFDITMYDQVLMSVVDSRADLLK